MLQQYKQYLKTAHLMLVEKSALERTGKDRRDYHFWPTIRMADGRVVNTRIAVKPEFDALH
jgi:hypothetical protein